MNIKEVAISAAKEAGEIIMLHYTADIQFSKKSEHDVLAAADLASETCILQHIKTNFPSHSIMSEEAGETMMDSEYLWVVDPLDGTINFVHHLDEFCVSIGVLYRGELILGVLYDPIKNDLYVAEKGKGAYKNETKLEVSNIDITTSALLAIDNTSNIEKRVQNFSLTTAICPSFSHIRIFGSAALHLAKIASGSMEAYYKLKPNFWDYAGGILLVTEAGGMVTDFAGNTVTATSTDILVTNGVLHTTLQNMINKHIAY